MDMNLEENTQEKFKLTHAPPVPGSSETQPQWLILKSGLLYFAIVFAVGFILGPIRVLWAVPRFGTRVGELMEMPFMLIAIILAALWVVRRLSVPPGLWTRLCMGLVALGFLLIAEFGAVLQLWGLSIAEYLANRDPVSGTIYILMLGVFAAMPWLVSRKKRGGHLSS
ncbi:hypothetical protein XM38_011090 [Halomicronema hongdechloris C2206]|uniref:Uncharacterized protein n=1 Tax=Halomicronema hongdechloris C2206 TaxID=1641165 RepID=A0A1Z3HIN2_9CYAN|nr:hypothetical protein [Halomicronema hongdechloris]ASC70179.1 hypothetical protein XM38_011090 [Halomicronema hongdechloris C2206]